MKAQILKKLGEHTSYLDYGDNDRPCIGYIRGDNYSIVVDGGNSPGNALAFLDKISDNEKDSIAAVLITHWHWDHIFGAETFGTKIVGFPKLLKQLENMKGKDWSPEGLESRLKEGSISEFSFRNQTNEIAVGGRGTIPSLDEIVEMKEFDLGDVTCIYEEIPSSHVDGSYVVYVPEDKVLFLGDCLWPDMEDPHNWHYDLEKFKSLCEALKDYEAEWYVDSHAEPINRETLLLWLERTLQIVKGIEVEGKEYEDIVQALPEKLRTADLGYNGIIEIAFK